MTAWGPGTLGPSGPSALYKPSQLAEALAKVVLREWQPPVYCGGRAGKESVIISMQNSQRSRGWPELQLCWVPLGKVLSPSEPGWNEVGNAVGKLGSLWWFSNNLQML